MSETRHHQPQRYRVDPNNPNVRAAAEMISRIIWEYVTTHTREECLELQRRVEERRRICDRLFGRPIPVIQDKEPPTSCS